MKIYSLYLLNILLIFYFHSVSGGYSGWTQWSQCSTTCGAGEKTRERTCNNPPPEHGGPNCLAQNLGDASETSVCNEGICPSE